MALRLAALICEAMENAPGEAPSEAMNAQMATCVRPTAPTPTILPVISSVEVTEDPPTEATREALRAALGELGLLPRA